MYSYIAKHGSRGLSAYAFVGYLYQVINIKEKKTLYFFHKEKGRQLHIGLSLKLLCCYIVYTIFLRAAVLTVNKDDYYIMQRTAL